MLGRAAAAALRRVAPAAVAQHAQSVVAAAAVAHLQAPAHVPQSAIGGGASAADTLGSMATASAAEAILRVQAAGDDDIFQWGELSDPRLSGLQLFTNGPDGQVANLPIQRLD
eukprot:TRINITY_DN7903_c0_g1_i2.p5 TRINITY_DN7903_c0_g1~~TRINITY_DN7903_c0_g1_i2.p5  ORF type:complete len:113 (+),score=19.86 TRINITY_DN7903_c0_g1_i2:106-444(+)